MSTANEIQNILDNYNIGILTYCEFIHQVASITILEINKF